MKQIHIRRFLSLLLAALTLWAAAVTAGSDSAAAALQQLRQGSRLPQQALRWELGDFFGLDSLSAVTVMTLAQSPLLLAGRSTVAALLSAGVTRDPPEPVAPESPDTPSSAASSLTDGLTFADNGVPAQTTAPTSSKGYTVVNGVYLKNSSGTELDADALSDGSFAAQLTDDGPQVLIVHSHGSEAYTPDGTDIYEPSDNNTRTLDENYNVVRVGDEMERVFTELGLTVVHDRTLYDYPKYNGAYDRSAEAVQRYLEQYPSIKIVLDVHRDALVGEDGTVYKAVTRIDGVDTAQVMLVLGSSEGGEHPNWMQNLSLACRIQESMNTLYPTLARPMTMRSSRYNQQLSNGSLLVEVGTHGNTLQEALAGARLFARAAGQVLLGLKE